MRLTAALAAILLLIGLAAVFAGRIAVWQAIGAGDPVGWLIIAELRLPRVLIGMTVGGGLALAGAAMQGYLRNPLADPGLFGISSSAALGAVVAIAAGAGGQPLAIAGAAMAGGIGGMALLALLAGGQGGVLVFTLAGVMLSSLTGALTALVISLAPSPFAAAEIMTWLIGSLADRSWIDLALAGPAVLAGALLLARAGHAFDALTLGDAAARSLGVNVPRLQWTMLVGVGLITGATVAVSGVIGFVGLVVPHLLRPLAGHRPAALLLPSLLGGAILVVAADAIVRMVAVAGELRLGIVMALLGAPFFLALLLRLRGRIA